MALEFYVEEADRGPRSAVANESVYAGELVHDDGDGADVLTYADTDADAGAHVGLARYDAQAMAAETMEDVVEEVYDAGQRVQYQEVEDSARVRIRTPEDNSTDPEPTIGHQDVVGVVDASAVQGSAAEFQGRVVQEGYDDGTTTFNRANNNFQAIGVAYRPDKMHASRAGDQSDTFDYPVRVVLFEDFKDTA